MIEIDVCRKKSEYFLQIFKLLKMMNKTCKRHAPLVRDLPPQTNAHIRGATAHVRTHATVSAPYCAVLIWTLRKPRGHIGQRWPIQLNAMADVFKHLKASEIAKPTFGGPR